MLRAEEDKDHKLFFDMWSAQDDNLLIFSCFIIDRYIPWSQYIKVYISSKWKGCLSLHWSASLFFPDWTSTMFCLSFWFCSYNGFLKIFKKTIHCLIIISLITGESILVYWNVSDFGVPQKLVKTAVSSFLSLSVNLI